MAQVPPSLFASEKWTSDSAYITARTMKSSFAIGSLLGPPLYVALLFTSKRARRFSVERLLNTSTVSALGVAGAGGIVSYSRSALTPSETLRQRRVELSYSVAQRREDDFGTIGGVLACCLVPAMFWNRAGLLDLTLGGGTLGYGAGFLIHHLQTYLGNPAGKAPEPEIPSDDPRMRRR